MIVDVFYPTFSPDSPATLVQTSGEIDDIRSLQISILITGLRVLLLILSIEQSA